MNTENDSLKDYLKKDYRQNTLYFLYQLAEWFGVLIFGVLILFFIISFSYSIVTFFGEYNEDLLVKNLLSCFEFLFLAPIPLFIISSSRKIFTGNLPSILEQSITEAEARKLFISSMIALASIFVINSFIDQINMLTNVDSVHAPLTETAITAISSLVMIVFILILIYFYKCLTKEKGPEKKEGQKKKEEQKMESSQ